MNARFQQLLLDWLSLLVVVVIAACIGGVVALAEAAFSWGLQLSIAFHQQHWLVLTCLLPLFGAGIVWLITTYGGLSKKGMNLVFEVSQGLTPRIPKRTLSMVTVCTWISHIAGASAGREGVAVQIGATISDLCRRHMPRFVNARIPFLIIGIAAGFAGLFGTPFTAAFFALEMFTAGKLEMISLLPAMSAAFAASTVGGLLGIHAESFYIGTSLMYTDWNVVWKLVLMGICFGFCGGLFAWLLHEGKALASKWLPNPIHRIVLLGIPTALLLIGLWQGRYSSTGSALVEGALHGSQIYPWDFALKMVMTIACLSIGFVGGEVTPLFTTGFCLGYTLGTLLGLDPLLCGALGYAAVFGAGTNTWLAAIMVGMELYGYQLFPFFFIVCSIAYVLNHNQSIYSLQRVLYAKDMQPLRIYTAEEREACEQALDASAASRK